MQETIKPYNEELDGKKSQVSRMFNNIAPYYDVLNRVLSLGIDVRWRKTAIEMLKESQPKRILDVATGTADFAIETKNQLNPDQIIGIDISSQMLAIGRKKIEQKGWSQMMTLEEGDSENLPFADESFDAVTVAFGVRNFEHLEKGLSEMRRVLKKDGKIIVLEFSKPRTFPFRQIFNNYFRYVLPLIGRLTSKDKQAYNYLYESVQAFPDGEDFINILQKTGYQSAAFKPLTLGICSIYSATK